MRRSHLLIGLSSPKPGRVPSAHGALEEWLLDRQVVRNLTPRTISWYRARLRPILDLIGSATPIDQVTVEHVRRHLANLRARGCADTTVLDDYRAIHAFTHWCARQGWPIDQRLLLMEPPRVGGQATPEIYTTAELALLQRHFADRLRNALIHGLLLGTGVRLSELVGIQLEDRQRAQLEVRWQTSKGRQRRWPPLSPTLQRDWVRYVQRERPRELGQLLLRSDGQPLSIYGVKNLLQRVGHMLGIHVHPHKYRHTCFTLIIRKSLEQGKPFDPEQLRLIAGWTSYAMIPRYVHLAKQDLLSGWEKVAPY